jgi:hypothetical protein
MGKFRKKPVVIEAELISDLMKNAENKWSALPEWVKSKYEAGDILFTSEYINIQTLEGTMRGEKNDYLIQGVMGEIYPCKPDIFLKTYEPVCE